MRASNLTIDIEDDISQNVASPGSSELQYCIVLSPSPNRSSLYKPSDCATLQTDRTLSLFMYDVAISNERFVFT